MGWNLEMRLDACHTQRPLLGVIPPQTITGSTGTTSAHEVAKGI